MQQLNRNRFNCGLGRKACDRVATIQPRKPKPSRLLARAHNLGGQEAEDQPSTSYSAAARRAYAQLVAPTQIGAEYGEGFLQFAAGGQPRCLDVAAINEQLRPGGALRHRFQLHPDEAYGTVFDFDTVIADTAGAYRRAWGRVAASRGLRLHPHARLAMHNTAPERIIMDVLGWTASMREARALAYELAEAYAAELSRLGEQVPVGGQERGQTGEQQAAATSSTASASSAEAKAVSTWACVESPGAASDGRSAAAADSTSGSAGVSGSRISGGPPPGVREWLGALTSFNVPVALVSALDRGTVRRALERLHLHDHFQVLVTSEDELESAAQRFLTASLRLRRPPNMCAVFAATPEAVTAAHNCTMKAVAVACSPDYPAYKLRSADVTVPSLQHLTVYNLRRLFAAAGEEFMDPRKQ
ncbi:hypothetical protein Agub_g11836, partial [Astrephomene gubernaculifera]